MYGTGSGDPGFAASSWCRVKARPAPPARRQPAWRSREFLDRLAHPVRLFHVKRTSQADPVATCPRERWRAPAGDTVMAGKALGDAARTESVGACPSHDDATR
jgi:hypothetical protein